MLVPGLHFLDRHLLPGQLDALLFGITQEAVDAFAVATDDRNFIHVNPPRAKEAGLPGTIAHGFFTLSLLAGGTVIISFFYLFHQGRLRREAQARKTYEAP